MAELPLQSITIGSNKYILSGSGGGSGDSTSEPTEDTVAEFDSDAHMNSTDMTTGSGSELENFIDGLNVSGGGEVETPTVTITATTGAIKYASAVRCGHIFMLEITVYNTASVAGGSNIFEGSINQTMYYPLLTATTSGFWGNRSMESLCRSTGTITVRNVSNSAMTATSSDPVTVAWTYIIA